MNPTLDLNVFGTRQTIAYLLGMTQNQRKSKVINGIRHLLRHQYATFKHGLGVGPLSAAEQASIQAGLAAANGDPEQAAEERARDVFSDISNAGRAALGPTGSGWPARHRRWQNPASPRASRLQ